MKLFRKIRLNVFVVFMAAFMLAFSLVAGVNFTLASAESGDPDALPADITYIDTEVAGIEFVQHPTNVFFGFRLTESDYDDFGQFEGDDRNRIERDKNGQETKNESYAEQLKTYERYVALWLTYWKNFSQMNSEGEKFDQLYAYWNGSAVGPWFNNTVTHRCTLKRLNYGFVISIPAGTTFPSATYVYGECQGAPIMYRTTENRAFYYNGSEFVSLAYEIAEGRIHAEAELNAVNGKLYYEAEKAEVEALVEAAKSDLKICLTSYAIQERMDAFYAALDGIMSKADYARLEELKTDAKASLVGYFDGLSESAYSGEDWAAILALKEDANAIIDSVTSFDQIDGAVAGIKASVNKVPTLQEREAFAGYRDAAVSRVGSAFEEDLYREAERAQGLALVQAGTQAVGNASTYDEVDAVTAEYIANIHALKTKAQWEAEEKADVGQGTEDESTDSSENNNVIVLPGNTENESGGGCKGTIIEVSVTLGVMAMAAATIIFIKYKAGKKDEK